MGGEKHTKIDVTLSVQFSTVLPLFWLQNKLSAITENRKQQLGKKKDMRREYPSGKFSMITGWEIKLKLKKCRKYIGKKVQRQ